MCVRRSFENKSIWHEPAHHLTGSEYITSHCHRLTKAKTWYSKIHSWKMSKPVFLSNITIIPIKLKESLLSNFSFNKSLHDIVSGKRCSSKKKCNNQACTAVAAERTYRNTVTPFQGNNKRKHLTRLLHSAILNKHLTCHHPLF